MDCRVFNNKLEDFQDERLPEDIGSAMERHMEKCTDCRAVYTTEQDMKSSFSMYFNINHLEYKRSRNEIMEKVDKGRYGKYPIKKFKYVFLSNKKKYIGAAAILLAVFIITPFIKNFGAMKMDSAKTSSSESMKNSAVKGATSNVGVIKEDKLGIEINYYKISKSEALKMISENYNVTKSVSSPDNKRNALIYGKGSEMTEEGYSKVILQDLAKNEYYIIELNDKKAQLTVKEITWRNNNNILAIVGMAYGMVTRGGNVYDLNLDTDELFLVYKTKDKKTEVTSIKRGDEFHYILNINEYTDDNMMESKQYKESITLK